MLPGEGVVSQSVTGRQRQREWVFRDWARLGAVGPLCELAEGKGRT